MATDVKDTDNEASQTPASRLVAEALVEGHDPAEIVDRAQALGLTPCLTDAVVAACCGDHGYHIDHATLTDISADARFSD